MMHVKKSIIGLGAIVAFCSVVIIMSFSPTPANAQVASVATCAGLGAAGGAAGGAVGGAALSAPSGLPVKDEALIAVQTANLVATTKIAGDTSTQSLVTCMLNGLAWAVAKKTVQSITYSTVNWINSGFQGSPAFVTDLQANLNQLSDTVANNFFAQLNKAAVGATGFNLVSPFQDQINQKLRANYYNATGNLLGLSQYDLQGHSTNPRDFLNGNFSQGGINAFFSASQNPANNPFGAYMLASDALWNQIDAATKQRNTELVAGKMFLPWRGNCTVNTTAALSLAKTDPCYGQAVKTPGAVVEAQLENVLGSGVRQLELADSINEIVGALMGQLVNQVLGPNGLLGTSQPSAGGGTSYLAQATSESQSTLTQGLTQNISNDLNNLTTYRTNWQKILDAATAAQTSCGTRSSITAVVTQATAAIANANTSIQQETAIQTSFQSAFTSTSVDASTKLATSAAQYQSYLGASTTPSYTDETFAADQSTDTSGSPTASQSLYSQMVAAKNSCPST